MVDLWVQFLGSSGYWIPCFSRNLNDWEIDTVKRLLLRLEDKKVIEGVEDKVL